MCKGSSFKSGNLAYTQVCLCIAEHIQDRQGLAGIRHKAPVQCCGGPWYVTLERNSCLHREGFLYNLLLGQCVGTFNCIPGGFGSRMPVYFTHMLL